MIAVCVLIELYALVLLARMALRWFEIPTTGSLASFARGLHLVTEPPMSAIRSFVPPARAGPGALDLSPMVLLFGLLLLGVLICR